MALTEFTKVGKIADFPEGRGRAVKLGDETVAVFRNKSGWFALQDACPHMGASLADGRIDCGAVICHWHGWKFALDSGQSDMRSWCRARVFALELRGEEVWLKPPAVVEEKPAAPVEEEWIRWDPDRFFKKKDG